MLEFNGFGDGNNSFRNGGYDSDFVFIRVETGGSDNDSIINVPLGSNFGVFTVVVVNRGGTGFDLGRNIGPGMLFIFSVQN